jgi:YHS domain-containing protein
VDVTDPFYDVDRDPVCGAELPAPDPELASEVDGEPVFFCSRACLARFLARPSEYVPTRD